MSRNVCPIKTSSALGQKPPGERAEVTLEDCPRQDRESFWAWALLFSLVLRAGGPACYLPSGLPATQPWALNGSPAATGGKGRSAPSSQSGLRFCCKPSLPPKGPQRGRRGGLGVRTPRFRASNPVNPPSRSPSLGWEAPSATGEGSPVPLPPCLPGPGNSSEARLLNVERTHTNSHSVALRQALF